MDRYVGEGQFVVLRVNGDQYSTCVAQASGCVHWLGQ